MSAQPGRDILVVDSAGITHQRLPADAETTTLPHGAVGLHGRHP